MKNQKGFSLIELLIVVLIIGIIAAIAIPNYVAARRAANESAALSSLRTLHSAQTTYQATAGGGNFASDLTVLRTVNLIDDILGAAATSIKSGYNFSGTSSNATGTTPAVFFFSAVPYQASGIAQTGSHRYCISTDGVIKFDTTLTTPFTQSTCEQSTSAWGN